MRITARTTLEALAAAVGEALARSGIRAVLTGGGCAVIYSRGEYQSEDLDWIIQSAVSREALDRAMARVGFVRQIDRYVHSESRFFVEFPRGPLSIGRDVQIEPVMVRIGSAKFLALSATDSCRDRLAAFYHWNDRQSLETAVLIALRSRVNTKKLRTGESDPGWGPRTLEPDQRGDLSVGDIGVSPDLLTSGARLSEIAG